MNFSKIACPAEDVATIPSIQKRGFKIPGRFFPDVRRVKVKYTRSGDEAATNGSGIKVATNVPHAAASAPDKL